MEIIIWKHRHHASPPWSTCQSSGPRCVSSILKVVRGLVLDDFPYLGIYTMVQTTNIHKI
jgi:hypothetical protein